MPNPVVKRLAPHALPTFVKVGYSIRDHNVELYRQNRRWSYIGKDALPNDPSILTWDKVKTGRNIPYWEGAQFYNHGRLVDPTLWQEDLYYYYSNRLNATVRTHEIITGYYGMNVRIFPGASTLLGGIVALVLMVVGVALLYVAFKRRDWL